MILDRWTATAESTQKQQQQQQMRFVADGFQLHFPYYDSGRRSQAVSSRSSSCADLSDQIKDCPVGQTDEGMDMIAGPMDEDCVPAAVQLAAGECKKSQRSAHRSFSRHAIAATRNRQTGYGASHSTVAALSTTPIDVWRQAAAAAAAASSAVPASSTSEWNLFSEASEEENAASAQPTLPSTGPRVITAGQRPSAMAQVNLPSQQQQQQIEYMNAQQKHQQFLIQQQYQQQHLAMIEQQRQQQVYINQQQQLAHYLRQQHQQQMIFAQQQRMISENNKENNNNNYSNNHHSRKRFNQYERRPFAVRKTDATPADSWTALDDDLSVLSCDDENNSLNGDVHRNRRDASLWHDTDDTSPPTHFFSVGDIIGYSNVVRAERHEALGALNAAIDRFSDEWPEIRRGWEHNLRLASCRARGPAGAVLSPPPAADSSDDSQ